MIDYKTILSTTQDKLTLLQWLKKVEEALKSGSATAVKGTTADDGTFKIEIDFADGTSLVSEPIAAGGLPDGYAIDASGNITLNDALHVAKNGDVEVGKDLEVDGNIVKGFAGIYEMPINLVWRELNIDCPVFEGVFFNSDALQDKPLFFTLFMEQDRDAPSSTASEATLMMLILQKEDGTPITNVSEIPSAKLDVTKAVALATRKQLESEINGLKSIFSLAKYQHTVTIKATATADAGGCYITLTGYSSKNTPIDSYQDLHSLFGGCALSASGAARLNAADSGKGALKLDLHGGTVATDAIVCLDASGAEHSIKLSALGSPAFSDDVCVPK